jgi:hypothetical protein
MEEDTARGAAEGFCSRIRWLVKVPSHSKLKFLLDVFEIVFVWKPGRSGYHCFLLFEVWVLTGLLEAYYFGTFQFQNIKGKAHL